MSKPNKRSDLRWRRDGESDQIVILHRDNFALPRILNPVAAMIFLLSDGTNTIEQIGENIAKEFATPDFDKLKSEVVECIMIFVDKEIVELITEKGAK